MAKTHRYDSPAHAVARTEAIMEARRREAGFGPYYHDDLARMMARGGDVTVCINGNPVETYLKRGTPIDASGEGSKRVDPRTGLSMRGGDK